MFQPAELGCGGLGKDPWLTKALIGQVSLNEVILITTHHGTVLIRQKRLKVSPQPFP